MIVVSDSSPLISLARVGCIDLLPHLFPIVHIPTEVYNEIVIAGSGLPGAREVARAAWIQVSPVQDTAKLQIPMEETRLGPGEVAVVQLAQELNAEVVLMDEWRARRYAGESGGFILFGCIGILEMLYKKKVLPDLRETYRILL